MARVTVETKDFRHGRTGEVGQHAAEDGQYIKDSVNIVATRKGLLRNCGGVKQVFEYPDLQKNDIIVPFRLKGEDFYFIYDPLLYRKFALKTDDDITGGGYFTDDRGSWDVRDSSSFHESYLEVNLKLLSWLQLFQDRPSFAGGVDGFYNYWTIRNREGEGQVSKMERFEELVKDNLYGSGSIAVRWNNYVSQLSPLAEDRRVSSAWYQRNIIVDAKGNILNAKCLRFLLSEERSLDKERTDWDSSEDTTDRYLIDPFGFRDEKFGKGTGSYRAIVRPNDVIFHDPAGILPTLRWGAYWPKDSEHSTSNPSGYETNDVRTFTYSSFALTEYRCLYDLKPSAENSDEIRDRDIPKAWFHSTLSKDEYDNFSEGASGGRAVPRSNVSRRAPDPGTEITMPDGLTASFIRNRGFDLWNATKNDLNESPYKRNTDNSISYEEDVVVLPGLQYHYRDFRNTKCVISTFNGYPVFESDYQTLSPEVPDPPASGVNQANAYTATQFEGSTIFSLGLRMFCGLPRPNRETGTNVILQSPATTSFFVSNLRKFSTLRVSVERQPLGEDAYFRIDEAIICGMFYVGFLDRGPLGDEAIINSLYDSFDKNRLVPTGIVATGDAPAGTHEYFRNDIATHWSLVNGVAAVLGAGRNNPPTTSNTRPLTEAVLRARPIHIPEGVYPGQVRPPELYSFSLWSNRDNRVVPNVQNLGAYALRLYTDQATTTLLQGISKDYFPFAAFLNEKTAFGGAKDFEDAMIVSSNDVRLDKIINTQRDYNVFDNDYEESGVTDDDRASTTRPLAFRSYLHRFALEGGGRIIWASQFFSKGTSNIVIGHSQGLITVPSLSLLDVINPRVETDTPFTDDSPVFLYGDRYTLDVKRDDVLYSRFHYDYDGRRQASSAGLFNDELRDGGGIRKLLGFREQGSLVIHVGTQAYVCLIDQRTDSRGWYRLNFGGEIQDVFNLGQKFMVQSDRKLFEWDVYGDTSYNIKGVNPKLSPLDADTFILKADQFDLDGNSDDTTARGELKGTFDCVAGAVTKNREPEEILDSSRGTITFDFKNDGTKAKATVGFFPSDGRPHDETDTPVNFYISKYKLIVGE